MNNEFFIELYPGKDLAQRMQPIKDRLISLLGDEIVNDPSKTKFLRDTPHFTMQVAHTHDMNGMLEAYRNVAQRFSPFQYHIEDVRTASKGGLREVHGTIDPRYEARFRNLHYALIEASLPFLAEEPPRMFPLSSYMRLGDIPSYELENLLYCHFPPGRGNYKPHASVGRFSEEILEREDVKTVLRDFEPRGYFSTEKLIVWSYIPNDTTFGVQNPIEISLGK